MVIQEFLKLQLCTNQRDLGAHIWQHLTNQKDPKVGYHLVQMNIWIVHDNASNRNDIATFVNDQPPQLWPKIPVICTNTLFVECIIPFTNQI